MLAIGVVQALCWLTTEMLLCAVTSCIIPNTNLQVSSLSSSSRLDSAVDNIVFLLSLKQFDYIIFADPSLFNRPDILQVFQAKLSASQINSSNLICLYPHFNSSDLKQRYIEEKNELIYSLRKECDRKPCYMAAEEVFDPHTRIMIPPCTLPC